MNDVERTLDAFIDEIKTSSEDQFKIFAKIDAVTLQPMDFDELPFAQQLTHILVSGEEIEVNFKTHFMLENARFFTVKKLKSENITKKQSIDFMKEFCNVVAGKTKAMLEAVEITMGQSLPFVMQGYNEMFYPNETGTVVHRAWQLTSDDRPINCSIKVNLINQSILPQIKKAKYTCEFGQESGEIELF